MRKKIRLWAIVDSKTKEIRKSQDALYIFETEAEAEWFKFRRDKIVEVELTIKE